MPKKSKITAVPVDMPVVDNSSSIEVPKTEAQEMTKVISEIKTEPVIEAKPKKKVAEHQKHLKQQRFQLQC